YQDGQNGYIWQSASGQANGYNYTLVVKKTDETSTPLKGASFQITRDRSGQIIDTVTTNDQGEATVTGLLMDDYTISETKAPAGYDFIDPVHVHADQFDNTAKTAVLTVQDKTLTTQLDVDKTWDDHDNQDGIRPDHVSVQLYANDQPSGSPVTLNAANNWHHAFVNLPVMKNGKRITYTVKEVNVPEGYTPSMSMSQARCDCGYTITNTHTPEVTRIQGVKTWDDHDNQDGIRPDNISVNLFADGVKIKTTHARKDTGWVYSFNNLPVYKNGKKITYTISETPVEGYTSTTTGFNLTNKHTPASTSVRVVKKWDDKDNQDKIRPNSIQVQLMANNEPSGSSVTLSKDTDWEYTFTNLPVYKAGKKIVYTVTETSTVTGYT
ncbi:Cna B-type domain-containing protein, partial [Alloscardovia theropitheci]